MEPETKKRRIEFAIIVVVILFLVGLTSLESNIYHVVLKVPISKNALVFSFINLNIVLITLLIFLVIRNTAKIVFGEKQAFGRLKVRTKLALAFVFFSIIPTIVMFIISSGFITHTINSWFSSQIESSLTQSLDIAKTYYENVAQNTISFSSTIGKTAVADGLFPNGSKEELKRFITAKMKELNLSSVEIYDAKGRLITFVESQNKVLSPTDKKQVFDALNGNLHTFIQSIGNSDIIKGFAPIYLTSSTIPEGLVVGSYFVNKSLVEKMAEIEQGYKEYRQQQILKPHLKTSYILFLVLISLLMIFSSIWMSVYIAKGISGQLDDLVSATKKIVANNYDVHIERKSKDEVGDLVDAFNSMAKELKQNRESLAIAYVEQTQRKAYIEAILNSISSGVIAIDGKGFITMINATTERVMGMDPSKTVNKYYKDILPGDIIIPAEEMLMYMKKNNTATNTKEITVNIQGQIKTFILRLTSLKHYNDRMSGYIVIFEDVTDIIKMQKIATWQEVAKRMAHEIKNPLTPIRLSAERLRRKYLDIIPSDKEVFDECTRTIVSEVDELKRLVDEFYSFARMPASQPTTNSINELLSEIYSLYSSAHKNIRFHLEKDEQVPLIKFDRSQIRRVLINLVENAVWAVNGDGEITLKSAYDNQNSIVRVEVIDTGIGIDDLDKSKIFDLYYSKKKGGSGIGLTIVQRIITEHGGRIIVKDNKPKGTKFIIELSAVEGNESLNGNGGKTVND
jgi:two-component system nitrogen regulation sensor histidine kinase NtrY